MLEQFVKLNTKIIKIKIKKRGRNEVAVRWKPNWPANLDDETQKYEIKTVRKEIDSSKWEIK